MPNRKQRRELEKEQKRAKKQSASGGSRTLEDYGLEVTNVPQPMDLTKDGKCSRCGGCCGSILTVTRDEIRALSDWAGKTGFEPRTLPGPDTVDMQCPFLVRREDGTTECACYDARPAVCRTFDCRSTNKENAQKWLDLNPDRKPEDEAPRPQNIWQVFGLTGLKLEGRDVPYHGGPRCRVTNDRHETYEFFAGRPVDLILTDGTRLPWSMVVAIYRNGLQVFSSLAHQLEFIEYGRIAEVLSGNLVQTLDDRLPGTDKETREAIRKAAREDPETTTTEQTEETNT